MLSLNVTVWENARLPTSFICLSSSQRWGLCLWNSEMGQNPSCSCPCQLSSHNDLSCCEELKLTLSEEPSSCSHPDSPKPCPTPPCSSFIPLKYSPLWNPKLPSVHSRVSPHCISDHRSRMSPYCSSNPWSNSVPSIVVSACFCFTLTRLHLIPGVWDLCSGKLLHSPSPQRVSVPECVSVSETCPILSRWCGHHMLIHLASISLASPYLPDSWLDTRGTKEKYQYYYP